MKILHIISNQLAPLTLAGAIIAFFYPPLFLVFKDIFLWLFAATMFALGLVLKPEELTDTLRQPKQIAVGLLAQYSLMPGFAFIAASIALYWGLPAEIALGLIIVGCAPGAMASNVVVYLAGGALAYSIALTTVATILSPLLTPALVQWLGGAFLPVAFWPLMKTILLTVVLPLFLGMLLARSSYKAVDTIRLMAPSVAVLSIVIICSYAIAANQTRLLSIGPQLLVLVVLVNLAGYAAGWWLAGRFKFDKRHQIALTIEIGMQNAGLGVALALKHFSPATALPGALFAVWCVLTAAGMSAWLRRRQKLSALSR